MTNRAERVRLPAPPISGSFSHLSGEHFYRSPHHIAMQPTLGKVRLQHKFHSCPCGERERENLCMIECLRVYSIIPPSSTAARS